MKNLLILFGNPFNKGPKENFRKLFCQKYNVKRVKNFIYLYVLLQNEKNCCIPSDIKVVDYFLWKGLKPNSEQLIYL